MEPIEIVSSSASEEDNELPKEPLDERLPKKLCRSSLSSYFSCLAER